MKILYDEQFKDFDIKEGDVIEYFGGSYVILGFTKVFVLDFGILCIDKDKYGTMINDEDIHMLQKSFFSHKEFLKKLDRIDEEDLSAYLIKLKMIGYFQNKDIFTREQVKEMNKDIKIRTRFKASYIYFDAFLGVLAFLWLYQYNVVVSSLISIILFFIMFVVDVKDTKEMEYYV